MIAVVCVVLFHVWEEAGVAPVPNMLFRTHARALNEPQVQADNKLTALCLP